MKIKLLFISVILFTFSFAQNLAEETSGSNRWIAHTPDWQSTSLFFAPWNGSSWNWSKQTEFRNNGNIIMSGNLGIGEANPTAKLHIYGDAKISHSLFILNHGSETYSGNLRIFTESNRLTFVPYDDGDWQWGREFGYNANTNSWYIDSNFGIGTLNPDEKLTVKGKIHAEEIKVDLAVPADYVFQKYFTGSSTLKPDYQMPSLTEIESFAKENHHLPNIPSAQEIQENGLQLGEMNNLLLQKVEELTLYIIEQNKRIEALETMVTENN